MTRMKRWHWLLLGGASVVGWLLVIAYVMIGTAVTSATGYGSPTFPLVVWIVVLGGWVVPVVLFQRARRAPR